MTCISTNRGSDKNVHLSKMNKSIAIRIFLTKRVSSMRDSSKKENIFSRIFAFSSRLGTCTASFNVGIVCRFSMFFCNFSVRPLGLGYSNFLYCSESFSMLRCRRTLWSTCPVTSSLINNCYDSTIKNKARIYGLNYMLTYFEHQRSPR